MERFSRRAARAPHKVAFFLARSRSCSKLDVANASASVRLLYRWNTLRHSLHNVLGSGEKRREDACALPKLRETKTRFHEFRTKRVGVRCVFASLSSWTFVGLRRDYE